jgi:rhodanese-related sulfurtransferase
MSAELNAQALYAKLGLQRAVFVVDVRDEQECRAQPRMIPGALRRDAARVSEWLDDLPRTPLAVICDATGQDTARDVVQQIAAGGHPTGVLAGGIAGWIEAGYPTVRMRDELSTPGGSRWITRERPKIDRLACPWLVRRFIDPDAQFFYTPPHRVRADAKVLGAEPYDITDVTFSHRGPRCSFDAFLEEFDLHDSVLDEVANIVRAADTGTLAESREAPGLLAISLGLSANIADDVLLLEQAMPVYDALYAWRKAASHETHSWPTPGA